MPEVTKADEIEARSMQAFIAGLVTQALYEAGKKFLKVEEIEITQGGDGLIRVTLARGIRVHIGITARAPSEL